MSNPEVAIENEQQESNDKITENAESNEIKQDAEDEEQVDQDSYLNRGEYSSERYKLEIKNLPRNFGFAQLRKMLKNLQLQFVKLSSPGKCKYAFVTFKNEEAKQEAMTKLNGHKFKGHELIAIPAKPAPDPKAAIKNNSAIRKRKLENQEDDNDKKVKTEDDNLTLDEKVQNSTTPLWKQSYEEQLTCKKDKVKQILKTIATKVETVNRELDDWLKQQKQNNDSMCCELVDYFPSPVSDDYRNKSEFSIGYDANETNSVVGFRLANYRSGSNEVVAPYACKNLPNQVRTFVKYFQTYLNDVAKYKAFNVRTHEGNYRQLTVRSNQKDEILAFVVFDKQKLTDSDINEERQRLKDYFQKDPVARDCKLVSLLFSLNAVSSGTGKNDNLELLFGEGVLYENLFDLKFRISPLAFFQANTKGAEVLYGKIGELCNIDKDTVVLDICCGTGTIGLTLARRAKLVVGVEIIQQAIDDAKLNSQLNGIENVQFVCGKAEDTLPGLIKKYENEKVIAIVDPPRAGLHSKVVQTLRRLKNLQTIIYVSCNAELAMNNFVDFARPTSNNYNYEPFVPTKALAVDMFPHTNHYELVLYLQRYNNSLLNTDNTNKN